MGPTERMSPDLIAHRLVTNVGSPVRVFLEESKLTVPTEPFDGSPPATETVPAAAFEAVVEDADIVDGGMNLFGVNGLHLPEREWRRLGLQKHWEAESADLRTPMGRPQRKLEIWASREDNLFTRDDKGEGGSVPFEHLEAVPDHSPVILEWQEHAPENSPSRPPVPLSRPKLTVDAVWAKGTTESGGFDRVEVGTIAGVEVLDTLDGWPEPPDIEQRDPPDRSRPPRHPAIDYDSIDPMPQVKEVLNAVQTINRHAKRLDEEASTAYQRKEGARARVHALRKRALYRTKTVAIHRLVKDDPETVVVDRHVLNDNHEMFCVSFEDKYAFHQPLEAVEEALLTDVEAAGGEVGDDTQPIDFTPSSDVAGLPYTLSTALEVLAEYDLNANAYLDATTVSDYTWQYDLSTTFSGLPDPS